MSASHTQFPQPLHPLNFSSALAHISDRLTLSANSSERLRALLISENIMSYASYPSYTSYPKVIFCAKLHRLAALPLAVRSSISLQPCHRPVQSPAAISLAIFCAKLHRPLALPLACAQAITEMLSSENIVLRVLRRSKIQERSTDPCRLQGALQVAEPWPTTHLPPDNYHPPFLVNVH